MAIIHLQTVDFWRDIGTGMVPHPSYSRRMSHSRDGSLVDGEGGDMGSHMSHRSPHTQRGPPSVTGSDTGDAVDHWVQDGILSQEQQTQLTALQVRHS